MPKWAIVALSVLLLSGIAGAREPCEDQARAFAKVNPTPLDPKWAATATYQDAKRALDRCLGGVERHQQEQLRKAEEKELLAAASAIRNESDEAHARDGKYIRAVLSMQVCEALDDKAAALEELREQRKYERVGGVRDLRAAMQMQNAVRWADQRIAEAKKRLREEKEKQTPCKDKQLARLLRCDNGGAEESDDCGSEDVQSYLRLAKANEPRR